MQTATRPLIRILDRAECERILDRNHIGRLAYARANQIDIAPVYFVFADGWLYGRTSQGRKTEIVGPHWWPVAFEVDEVEELFRWRSVVVRGGLYPLRQDGSREQEAILDRAVSLLRRIIPETLTDRDPFPERTVLFRIAVQEVSGREATPASIATSCGGSPDT
jgi:uncharacterized protein